MNSNRIIAVSLILLGLNSAAARAERPPQGKDEANLVVTGLVRRIFVHNSLGSTDYLVEIQVGSVDASAGNIPTKPGDTIYAYCFRARPTNPPIIGPSGHKKIPRENLEIRAYLCLTSGGVLEGLYPDWFEQHDPPALGIFTRQSRYKDDPVVQVAQVGAGTPAERGGLHVGDWILSVNDEPTFSNEALKEALARSGRSARLRYVDGKSGKEKTVEVKLPPVPAYSPVPKLRSREEAS